MRFLCGVAVFVAVATWATDAQNFGPPPPGGAPPPPPPPPPSPPAGEQPPPPSVYSWIRDLGNGLEVREQAIRVPDKEVVYVLSPNPALQREGILPTTTVYDFTMPNPVVAIAPLNGPCILVQTDLTFRELIDDLSVIDGTTARTDDRRTIDATTELLPKDDVEALFADHPALQPVCSGGQFIVAAPPGESSTYVGETTVLASLTFDSMLNIIIPAPPQDQPQLPPTDGSEPQPPVPLSPFERPIEEPFQDGSSSDSVPPPLPLPSGPPPPPRADGNDQEPSRPLPSGPPRRPPLRGPEFRRPPPPPEGFGGSRVNRPPPPRRPSRSA